MSWCATRGCGDEGQYCAWCREIAARAGIVLTPQPIVAAPIQYPPAPKVVAALKEDRYRSRTERRYAERLAADATILAWHYEPCKLWLAPKTTFTCDFLVHRAEQPLLEMHEVKPRWFREDGWIKLKVAAAHYPCFQFVLAQWKENAWHLKEVPAC